MPYTFELDGLNGLGDLTTMPDGSLSEALHLLESLYNLYRVKYKDVKMMRLLKSIMAKIRMEFGLRARKVKSCDRRKFIGDVSNDFEILKADAIRYLKERGIEPQGKLKTGKTIPTLLQAMLIDLKTDPMGLDKLARKSEDQKQISTFDNLKARTQITHKEITEIKRLYNLATRDGMGIQRESAKMMFQRHVEDLIASGKAKRSEIEEFLSQ